LWVRCRGRKAPTSNTTNSSTPNRMNGSLNKTQVVLAALALWMSGVVTATAATAAVNARIVTRSLSPQDKTDYSLTGLQGASGLNTVGVGQPVYAEVQIGLSTPPSNIVSVTWALTERPLGSTATLEPSPLGANVPIASSADALTHWLSARTMLRPDVEGVYVLGATVTTTTSSTNITQKITGARFLGYEQACRACHDGNFRAPDMSSYTNTPHATAFAQNIDDSMGHFATRCFSCHVVGYDDNTNAVNGGFDDVARQLGWSLPAVLTNGNWAATPPEIQNVANVQCESCHGAGSRHVVHAGVVGNPETISVSFDSGNCAQCHDSAWRHIKTTEWENSRHAVATTSPTGPSRGDCVKCHSGKSFVETVKGASVIHTDYEPIGCVTCHDPHSAEHPGQLRKAGPIALMDGITTIQEPGAGAICMSCHMGRRNATNYVEVTTGSGNFGPHHSNQADMLAGANAITYGKVIGSSAHARAVEDSCVGCHMQPVANTEPGFSAVGGHTFMLSLETSTNRIELVTACTECHGEIEDFNLVRQDYNGDGVVEGIQSEVKALLRRLAKLLPPVGVDKETISINSSWTKQQLRAGFNWKFVGEEGSFGVHNPAYAVGLLKASIADLTGDSNEDGLPDEWQIRYFGSANAPNAAPNATPANDGVPNWLKWSLGLDPLIPGIQVPGGYVWANASSMGGSTDEIQIYTAAEVVFNTEPGKTYQLQAISTLGGGWTNVGAPVTGTGSAFSMVTPTRSNTQQFFRVVTNP